MRAGRIAAFSICWLLLPSGAMGDDASKRAGASKSQGAGVSARADASRPREGRLEASGFVGYSSFGDSELGNSWAPDQVPRRSAVLGARLGWRAVPALSGSGPEALALVLEAEVTLSPAFTGETPSTDRDARMSYFAPVFGWRAHALFRKPLGSLGVHALIGAGGATIASKSPFMAKETDPQAYAGVGATLAIAGSWQLRLDGRLGVMPGRSTSATRVSELQLGLITSFGVATRMAPRRPPPPPPAPPVTDQAEAVDDTDGDKDGIPDRLDRCPAEPETVNGIADEDGCPEPDPDGDGVIGAADKCPMEAEDMDHFEDEDGCPERDNDRDGIDDARDVCPNGPETRNGYADADGCPDTIPETVTRALASAEGVKFESGRARVTTAAKRALQPVQALLEAENELAIEIVGIPDKAGGEELAKRRAEAVKWYFVDLGIAEDRIDTTVGPVGGASTVVLKLR